MACFRLAWISYGVAGTVSECSSRSEHATGDEEEGALEPWNSRATTLFCRPPPPLLVILSALPLPLARGRVRTGERRTERASARRRDGRPAEKTKVAASTRRLVCARSRRERRAAAWAAADRVTELIPHRGDGKTTGMDWTWK